MDEIVDFEIPRQIDKVLELTGAQNVTVLASSMATMRLLSLLSSNRKYAARVHAHIQSGPIIYNRGANNLLRNFHSTLCRDLPEDLGILIFSELLATQLPHDTLLAMSNLRKSRYTLTWALYTLIGGPSPTYQALIEPAFLGHLFQPLSWRELKHYCQQVVEGRLQRFDYGLVENLRRYGNSRPPTHDLAKLGIAKWMIVSAGNDNIATRESVQQIIEQSYPKPNQQLFVPEFNHFDLRSALQVDRRVNLPILRFLDKCQLPPLVQPPEQSTISESLKRSGELERFVPTPQSHPKFHFRRSLNSAPHPVAELQKDLVSELSNSLLSKQAFRVLVGDCIN